MTTEVPACEGHKHGGKCEECGKHLIFVEKFSMTLHDDGSICDKVVTPEEPRYTSEQVLAGLLSERGHAEAEHRRNRRGKKLNA